MHKLGSMLFILFMILAGTFMTSLNGANYNKILQEFIISSKIDVDQIQNADFKVHILPTPHIKINKANIDKHLELNDIKLYFSLWSILQFSPKINYLEIEKANLFLKHEDIHINNHHELITELLGEKELHLAAYIKTLKFIESDKDEALTIDNFRYKNNDKQIDLKGMINNYGTLTATIQQIKNNTANNFDLKINGQNFTLELIENYGLNSNKLQNGSITYVSSKLPLLLGKLLPDIDEYIQTNASEEEITIKSDIKLIEKELLLDNISITSESIEASGNYRFDQDKNFSDLNIHFKKLDLYNWQQGIGPNKTNIKFYNGSAARLDFSKDNFSINIQADKINISQNQSLDNFVFQAKTKEGKLVIDNMSASYGENGNLLISGQAEQNPFRSIFFGKIELKNNNINDLFRILFNEIDSKDINQTGNYTLSSSLELSSVNLSLTDLKINMENNEISGDLSTKFIGDSPRTNAKLKINNINIDTPNLPFIDSIKNFLYQLSTNMKKQEYLALYTPIRRIKAISNYDISIQEVVYNKQKYNNFITSINLAPNKVAVENLSFNSGEDFLNADIELITTELKPKLNINIKNGQVKGEFPTIQSMIDIRNKTLEDFSFDKIDLKFDINLNKFYSADKSITNLSLSGNNNNTLFNIKKFSGNLLDGKIIASGSILLEPLTLNFVYGLNSISMNSLNQIIPGNIINPNGTMSASGMFSSNGDKFNELIYNFYSKSDLIVKDTKLSNFSIDTFITQIDLKDYSKENLSLDMKKALLTGESNLEYIKSDLQVAKGLISFPNFTIATKNSTATGSASLNIYTFDLNIDSIFTFPIYHEMHQGRRKSTKFDLPIKVSGSLFSPKKEAQYSELINLLENKK